MTGGLEDGEAIAASKGSDVLDASGPEILAALQRPDDLSRRFNPLGLGGSLNPEAAAQFQAAAIAAAVLSESVPEQLRQSFNRVRKLHLYGVLEYAFFTVADQQALLVMEGALRVRFLTYYATGIPVDKRGKPAVLTAATFDEAREARGLRLLDSHGRTHPLPIGSKALFRWARRERLLPGTQTRGVDEALSNLRNFAAHPTGHTVLMPVDSAATIRDVAEIINKLWGHDTPGGRLFPGPKARQPRVVGLSPELDKSIELRLDQVAGMEEEQHDWRFAVFLVADDERLMDIPIGLSYQSGFQATHFPCEMLWEGNWADLTAATDAGQFNGRGDTVEWLDRLFFVRKEGDTTDLARSTDDLLALDAPPDGDWYAITADTPIHAFVHVRDHEPRSTGDTEECRDCHVLVRERFASVAEAVAAARSSVS